MKKYLILTFSIFISLFCFLHLSSYADILDYHETGYTSMRISAGGSNPHPSYTIYESEHDLIAYVTSSDSYFRHCTMIPSDNIVNNRSYTVTSHFYSWNDNLGAYEESVAAGQTSTSINFNLPKTDNSVIISGIVFSSYSDAYDYLINGDDSGISGGSFPDLDINWGENGDPEYGDPSEDIPAPIFNVSRYTNGNIMKSVTFLNYEYDPRAQDGRYGLVMRISWSSCNGFTIKDKSLLSSERYIYYSSTLPFGDKEYIYDVPIKESDFNYCPQFINFDQNEKSVSAFNNYLSTYPVANRSVDSGIAETFRSWLELPKCPYNTLIFTCCYYKKMEDGTYKFGPYTTGTFYPPAQGSLWKVGTQGATSNSDGMINGQGGGLNGQSETPFGNAGWNQNFGDGTNPQINYGSNVDPQNLVDNMQNMFGLVGQMPSFVGQLISFLPPWILQFIAVSLGLAIAIGVVKLFIG